MAVWSRGTTGYRSTTGKAISSREIPLKILTAVLNTNHVTPPLPSWPTSSVWDSFLLSKVWIFVLPLWYYLRYLFIFSSWICLCSYSIITRLILVTLFTPEVYSIMHLVLNVNHCISRTLRELRWHFGWPALVCCGIQGFKFKFKFIELWFN